MTTVQTMTNLLAVKALCKYIYFISPVVLGFVLVSGCLFVCTLTKKFIEVAVYLCHLVA